MSEGLYIYTLVGDVLLVVSVCRKCPVEIYDMTMTANLISLELLEFDVILGIHFLSMYYSSTIRISSVKD